MEKNVTCCLLNANGWVGFRQLIFPQIEFFTLQLFFHARPVEPPISFSYEIPLPYFHCNGNPFPPISNTHPQAYASAHTWKAFRLHLNSIKYIVSMNLPFWFRIAIHFVSMEKSRIATNNAKNCHLLKSFETATAAVALKIELRLWIDSYRCICNGICIHFVFPTSRTHMHKSIEILWRRKWIWERKNNFLLFDCDNRIGGEIPQNDCF